MLFGMYRLISSFVCGTTRVTNSFSRNHSSNLGCVHQCLVSTGKVIVVLLSFVDGFIIMSVLKLFKMFSWIGVLSVWMCSLTPCCSVLCHIQSHAYFQLFFFTALKGLETMIHQKHLEQKASNTSQ